MKQNLQPNNQKNELNNSEKITLLKLLHEKKLNNKLQAALYQRGDQTTKENGGAKYIQVTESGLYKQNLEIPEENLRNQINMKKQLEPYDTVLDLGPGGGRTTKYMQSTQLYRPIDVSAHVIDQIKKGQHSSVEGTVGDWFETRVFDEALGKKAYIIGKTIPNLSDEEITELTKLLKPTQGGKSMLTLSYFPSFNETQENINELKAMYGDADKNNPYYNKASEESIADFVTGLLIGVGFPQESITSTVVYDKQNHAIILNAKIEKDISIDINGEVFSWKQGDNIPLVQSRRISDSYVEKLLAKNGWKRKECKTDKRVSVAIFEKKDPQRKQNIIKKITKAGLLTLGLLSATIAGNKMYEQHQKDTFLREKQEQIHKNLAKTYDANQIAYFDKTIQETSVILKTFYGIQDDGYINGLIRPYIISHDDLASNIMKNKGYSGSISPIATELSEYIAMMIMKDQEKHNFLEYVGDDKLGYKKFDSKIPNMLQTLQYYDSIYAENNNYKIKKNQELVVRKESTSSTGISPLSGSSKLIGQGIIYPEIEANIYTINNPTWINKDNGPIYIVAESFEGLWPHHTTQQFIGNYLSYRHQTKYLARQAALYIKENLRSPEEGRDREELTYMHDIEHILQEFVLNCGDTRQYIESKSIGKEVFEDIIKKSPKCMQYFKEQLLIDLEIMEKGLGYENRRGKYAMQGGESSGYRNNPEYQKANTDFFSRSNQ